MAEAIIRLKIRPLREGGFLCTSPDVPGLIAEGRTMAEATEIARDIARKIAESCIEHGDKLPKALAPLRTNGSSRREHEFRIPVGVR